MPEAAAIVPLAEAARLRGVGEARLRRLARKHSGSFITRKGGKGAGRCTLVDLRKLDELLTPASTDLELAQRKAGILDASAATLAKRFAEMHIGDELSRLGIKLSRKDATRIAAYTWGATVEALRAEYVKVGIEPPPFKVPEEIVALIDF